MNILINTSAALDPNLVDQLVKLPETSIYLSLSHDDTLRILRETRPEILITERAMATGDFIRQIEDKFPELEIYIYNNPGSKSVSYALEPYPKTKRVAPDPHSTVNPGLPGDITRILQDISNGLTIKQNTNLSRRRSK